MVSLTSVFLISLLTHGTNSANILFYLPDAPHSHHAWAASLVQSLASKGDHNVTVIIPHTSPRRIVYNESLITEIIVDPVVELDYLGTKLAWGGLTNFRLLVSYLPVAEETCRKTLNDPRVRKWLETRNRTVDMVITDMWFSECALGIAHKFKASVDDVPPSFLYRVVITHLALFWRLTRYYVFLPRIEIAMLENLNFTEEQLLTLPPMEEMVSNISLVLVNSHFSEEYGRSFPPMVVPVGGMHLSERIEEHQLPKDIAAFIQTSKTLVYISFGTMVTPSSGSFLRNVVISTIQNLPQIHFLVKWDSTMASTDLPKNAFVSAWIPQRTILAHPKTCIFVNQGGLLSTQEAIYHGVPVVAIPIFGDQGFVSDRMHRTKRGVRLFLKTLTNSSLSDAISTVLQNDEYKINMGKTSQLFKDRPEKPIETAKWWVEYVLRHGSDTQVMRPLAARQYWFQKRLLDVWIFTGILFITIILVILKRVLICCKLCNHCLAGFNRNPNVRKIRKD